MIRVMIVDDSSTSRQLLRHIVISAPDMTVVAELKNGEEAVQEVRRLRPDVILMDVVMPVKDGLEATSDIMSQFPTPIVMVSAAHGHETEMAFKAIKRGALTLLPKPDGPTHPDHENQALRLTGVLRAMSNVRVIHHKAQSQQEGQQQPRPSSVKDTLSDPPKIVGIVSSTGGPAALAEIFQALPAHFPLPILVVQHIAADFQASLINWLNQVSPLPVRMASEGEPVQPGITFGPSGTHITVDAECNIRLIDQPTTTHMPSGDMLLSSIARVYQGAGIGVVLTGMGKDGAQGLFDMHQERALTIVQNKATSAVYGMPAAAKQLGAARYELSLQLISLMLRDISEKEIL